MREVASSILAIPHFPRGIEFPIVSDVFPLSLGYVTSHGGSRNRHSNYRTSVLQNICWVFFRRPEYRKPGHFRGCTVVDWSRAVGSKRAVMHRALLIALFPFFDSEAPCITSLVGGLLFVFGSCMGGLPFLPILAIHFTILAIHFTLRPLRRARVCFGEYNVQA